MVMVASLASFPRQFIDRDFYAHTPLEEAFNIHKAHERDRIRKAKERRKEQQKRKSQPTDAIQTGGAE